MKKHLKKHKAFYVAATIVIAYFAIHYLIVFILMEHTIAHNVNVKAKWLQKYAEIKLQQ
ncbi:hypothetical protein [Cysteiniphilum halobium]|uniref:hypothetical protein n=1 Tax=Cysteiniphilum halobium TaxID=2219059 RepID=UPI003F8705A8